MAERCRKVFRAKGYADALRCMEKATRTLEKSLVCNDMLYYADENYVKKACRQAAKGVRIALYTYNCIRSTRMLPEKRDMSEFDFDESSFGRDDAGQALGELAMNAYRALWWDKDAVFSMVKISSLQDGFKTAFDIIEYIRPPVKVDAVQEP